jgi:hypothetical protein
MRSSTCLVFLAISLVLTVQTATPATRSAAAVRVNATLNTAVLSFASTAPSRALLRLGTDTTYGLMVSDRLKARHSIRVSGLAPATK